MWQATKARWRGAVWLAMWELRCETDVCDGVDYGVHGSRSLGICNWQSDRCEVDSCAGEFMSLCLLVVWLCLLACHLLMSHRSQPCSNRPSPDQSVLHGQLLELRAPVSYRHSVLPVLTGPQDSIVAVTGDVRLGRASANRGTAVLGGQLRSVWGC